VRHLNTIYGVRTVPSPLSCDFRENFRFNPTTKCCGEGRGGGSGGRRGDEVIWLRFSCLRCTVIRFMCVSVSAKFGTCTVMSVNGALVEDKCIDSRVNVHILASKNDPFTLTTVQVPNLALTHTKRITVWSVLGNLL
jgi:hypothetical protein